MLLGPCCSSCLPQPLYAQHVISVYSSRQHPVVLLLANSDSRPAMTWRRGAHKCFEKPPSSSSSSSPWRRLRRRPPRPLPPCPPAAAPGPAIRRGPWRGRCILGRSSPTWLSAWPPRSPRRRLGLRAGRRQPQAQLKLWRRTSITFRNRSSSQTDIHSFSSASWILYYTPSYWSVRNI